MMRRLRAIYHDIDIYAQRRYAIPAHDREEMLRHSMREDILSEFLLIMLACWRYVISAAPPSVSFFSLRLPSRHFAAILAP